MARKAGSHRGNVDARQNMVGDMGLIQRPRISCCAASEVKSEFTQYGTLTNVTVHKLKSFLPIEMSITIEMTRL